jgi:hypothetical protein
MTVTPASVQPPNVINSDSKASMALCFESA